MCLLGVPSSNGDFELWSDMVGQLCDSIYVCIRNKEIKCENKCFAGFGLPDFAPKKNI